MTKLVQFSDEAYRRLKNAKRGDESFSDLVLRRFPQGDLANLGKLRARENLKIHEKWTKRIDAMDRPGA